MITDTYEGLIFMSDECWICSGLGVVGLKNKKCPDCHSTGKNPERKTFGANYL